MKIIFKVEGMSCQHCINAIKKEFEKAGIKNFNVQIGLVEVEMSENQNKTEYIKTLIEDAGYKVVNE